MVQIGKTFRFRRNAYPWVVKGDPVFYPITKSLKAQVGVVIKESDHAAVLPTAVFLLKNLKICM